jgi:type II secretory pathway component PulC
VAPSRAATPVAEKRAEALPPKLPASPGGVILRAELNQVLDGAPGRFLAHLDPSPVFLSGRFHGWRLVTFFPGDARFSGVDLRAGDVVTRVNGQSVERPEQLMHVWDGLRSSTELVVEIERAGSPRTLRWAIRNE